jgi:copper(I)-binding protein
MGTPALSAAPAARGLALRHRRLAALVCTGALLSGCGHSDEVVQSGGVGADGRVGDVLLRNLYVENPPQAGYPGGSDATARVTLINRAGRSDTLTGVTTDVAQRVEILARTDCDGTPQTLSSLELPARADSSGAPGGPGPNETGYTLRLVDLRTGILQGGSIPIEFTFRQAGSITLPAPVGTGRPATSGPSPTCTGG